MRKINIMHTSKAFFRNAVVKYTFLFLLICSGSALSAQAKMQTDTISGKVIDAVTLKPVGAAQISITDKNVSALTDENGEFKIKMTSKKDILQVKAIGYDMREVGMQGRMKVTVALYKSGFSNYYKSIDMLTGVQNQSAITSSVSSYENPDRYSAMIADDIIRQFAGGNVRSVNRSGAVGMGSNFFIRGVNSINASAQPLFVVDGVIWNNFQDFNSIHGGHFSNPLENISINDIASVSVIKDGTSIYGSKASNGVVIINTKRAKSMVTSIDLNISAGITETPGSLPMMNGEQFRVYASDMLGSLGYTSSDLTNVGFLVTDPDDTQYNQYHNVTDWGKSVYQQGMTQNYMINVKGGDDKALYYFSLGYAGNQGVVKTTNWDRINIRLNGDFKLFKKMDLAVNIGIARNERSLVDDGVNYFSSPSWIAKVKSPFLSPNSFTNTGDKTANQATTDIFNVGNPGALIDNSFNFQKKYWFNISALPTYRITPELRISSHFDYSLYKTTEGHFIPMDYTPVRFIENKGYSKNRISSQVSRNTGVFSNTYLTYEKKIDTYQYIKAIAGLRYINNYLESDYVEEHNSGSNNNTTITGKYNFLKVDGINNLTKSVSNYYNAEYIYDNRYFANATMSFDASSRFGRHTEQGLHLNSYVKDKETGEVITDRSRSVAVFPALNAGWIVSAEEFMKDLNALNYFKLRAGYGVTGNDGIKDYESMAYFSAVRFLDRANGLVLANLENTKIQWETTGKANLGFDLGFFDDLLTLQFDLYSSKTTNLLTLRPLPEVAGLGVYWSNGGSMTNNGFELNAMVKVLNTKDFQWEIGVSAGAYKNKVTALPDNLSYILTTYGGELLTTVGQPVGVFYGYKTSGVFATEAAAETANLKILNQDGAYTAFGAGDMIFEDYVADGIIDEKDRQIIGNPHPDMYGNFNSTFNYGHFSLNAVFTYSLGNDVYNFNRRMLESGSDFGNQTTAMLRRWTGEGQETIIPKSVYGDPMRNARFSDRWIEDGSYLKFKTISVSYQLPMKSDYIEGVKFWASVDNIHTWSRYLGLDPEVSGGNSPFLQGIDAGLLPLTRSYNLGVKINL